MLAELQRRAGGADRFAVVDTETTGVYSSDRVVELAIVTLALDGEVIDTFDTLVNPCRDVSASHVHGITASMVADAPIFEEIAGDVALRLHGARCTPTAATVLRSRPLRDCAARVGSGGATRSGRSSFPMLR